MKWNEHSWVEFGLFAFWLCALCFDEEITLAFLQSLSPWTHSTQEGTTGDNTVKSGDSFIPFLVWGLFKLCRSLPKTYKPPLKTDKTPLETDKPPPKTNKPPLEADKPPPETDKPPPKIAKLRTALSTTITGRSRSLNHQCSTLFFCCAPHSHSNSPFRALPTEFPLHSQQTSTKLPQKTTKFPPNSHQKTQNYHFSRSSRWIPTKLPPKTTKCPLDFQEVIKGQRAPARHSLRLPAGHLEETAPEQSKVYEAQHKNQSTASTASQQNASIFLKFSLGFPSTPLHGI